MPKPTKAESAAQAYAEAERRIAEAARNGAKKLILSIRGLTVVPPLVGLSALRSLDLSATQVSDLSPLASLTALQTLNLSVTQVCDLAPLASLTTLQFLDLWASPVVDLSPLAGMLALRSIDLRRTHVLDLTPLANLNMLRSLDLRDTQVSDLTPLAGLTALIDAEINDQGGLAFDASHMEDKNVRAFAWVYRPDRTEKTINYIRRQLGLSAYPSSEPPNPTIATVSNGPKPLEGVPSPFDFKLTETGTITVAGSDTNVPAFPFPVSAQDHAQRLNASRVLANDVASALARAQYNVRSEYLSYLRKYLQRLPQNADDGNMLLADAMARALRDIFAADVEVLPPGFASGLRTFLQQHVALCAYYPEIGTFNRDVRSGSLSRQFPQRAAEKFADSVLAFTPEVFEPSVPQAIADARTATPPALAAAVGAPAPSPETIQPPPNPGGEVDPRKSREFATASTANRLWKVVVVTGKVGTAIEGISKVANVLAPYAEEMIQWLAEFLESVE